MAKSVVIVESPTKAKTLKKYLGSGFSVLASKGHVKDLPSNKLSVDVEHGFEPVIAIMKGKKPVIDEIKEKCLGADSIYLAPDPDREGEAIAWHIAEELKTNKKIKGKVHRVLFHEITKAKVMEAIKNPVTLDHNKYEAQLTRRILDRLVGYQISPILWDKVRRGISAGRVQSVALRMICEREKEILAFKSEEYWHIHVVLETLKKEQLKAKLFKIKGEDVDLNNQVMTQAIVDQIKDADFSVSKLEQKERQKKPPAPFITSTLEQEAFRKFRFSAKRTMMMAQKLYEGVDIGDEGTVGLITYMRTDSVRVGDEALKSARDYIGSHYAADYLPKQPNVYSNKKGSQDAHEAIRPTDAAHTPEKVKPFLEPDQFKVYDLIWKRFVASQMTNAIHDMTTVDMNVKDFVFRANGSILKFKGYLELYMEGNDDKADESDDDRLLPPLKLNDKLHLVDIQPTQHFTEPPPRFNESSLIRALEANGVGRPSTYATILSTIESREYTEKDAGRFKPTELGMIVSDLLVKSFPNIVNVEFTAQMEEQLDDVEDGKRKRLEILTSFYDGFSKSLGTAKVEMEDVKRKEEVTDIKCEKCGNDMVVKWARFGKFLACKGYPECKNTKEIAKDGSNKVTAREEIVTDKKCEKCGKPMVMKRGRFGEFLACSGYPECKTTKAIGIDIKCPKDGGELSKRKSKKGKLFYGCTNYPKCDFATWFKPVQTPCPLCQYAILVEKTKKGSDPILSCINEGCGYQSVS